MNRRTLLARSSPARLDDRRRPGRRRPGRGPRGPSGHRPVHGAERRGRRPPPPTSTLTDEELAQIREMGATAAIVMHYGGNDWSRAQINGLETQFEAMGIEVIAITDAGFKPETQVANLETVMAQSPDIIVSIPTDPVATAAAYQAVSDAGVKLVFMDNVPAGFVAGEDYVSSVSADNYGNGVASAHLMAQALGEEGGQIGLVFHAADFFVTRQRYDAFKATIAAELSRTSRSSTSRASAGRTSRATPTARPPPC